MAKRWQYLQIYIPLDREHLNVHMCKVIAHVCNKMNVKAGGLLVFNHYIRGEAFYNECLVFAEELPSARRLEQWGLEALGRKPVPRRKK
jgi:hypothetical protein